MKFRLLGYSEVDFTSPEGNHITGHNLFVGYQDERTTGMRTEKLFVKGEIELPQVKTGEIIDIAFNHKGRIESITKE